MSSSLLSSLWFIETDVIFSRIIHNINMTYDVFFGQKFLNPNLSHIRIIYFSNMRSFFIGTIEILKSPKLVSLIFMIM